MAAHKYTDIKLKPKMNYILAFQLHQCIDTVILDLLIVQRSCFKRGRKQKMIAYCSENLQQKYLMWSPIVL